MCGRTRSPACPRPVRAARRRGPRYARPRSGGRSPGSGRMASHSFAWCTPPCAPTLRGEQRAPDHASVSCAPLCAPTPRYGTVRDGTGRHGTVRAGMALRYAPRRSRGLRDGARRITQVSCRDPAHPFSSGFDSRRLHYKNTAIAVSVAIRVPWMCPAEFESPPGGGADR
jgi:hypothetical protein